MGGRLSSSPDKYDIKYPIVLPSPKVCKLSKLLIEHFHSTVSHQGRAITIAAMRGQGIWILGSTSCVSSVIRECLICRRLYSAPQGQLMSDLPEARVTPAPPFSYSGVDVFGPFTVKAGRKLLKRYGILFICMASRAVHIELTDSLSTDAFISSLRRFIALRGAVRVLY